MSRLTRRGFLTRSAAAGSSLLLMGTRASGRVRGANDRILRSQSVGRRDCQLRSSRVTRKAWLPKNIG